MSNEYGVDAGKRVWRWLGTAIFLMCVHLHGALAAPVASPALKPSFTQQVGMMGLVRVYAPASIENVVLLASGDGSWDDPLMSDLARVLLQEHALVIGIDTPKYLAELQRHDNECADVEGDAQDVLHAIEKQAGMQRYLAPVVMGYSSGASLAYALMAQAPKGTFSAAVSLGFCDYLQPPISLCNAAQPLSKPALVRNAEGKMEARSLLLPVAALPGPWSILQGQTDPYCKVADAQRFAAQVAGTQFKVLSGVDHFFEDETRWQPALLNTWRELAQRNAQAVLPPGVSDLPIAEVPATAPGDELAILLTGDGGWAETDQGLAHELASRGIAVVGLSSLKYFWTERPPAQAAQDLARLIQHYTQTWHRSRVRLLGYSFGADVLPAIINAMPASTRQQVVGVGLMALLPRTSLEIQVAGWFGRVVGEIQTRPELEKLAAKSVPVSCVYGERDEESLCPKLPATLARVVKLPGHHDCNNDYRAVVDAWLGRR